MTDDALLQLLCDALGLMNRAFVNFNEPRSVELELYHQFRKLWDRGIPVGMGLGHLIIRTAPGMDLVIAQHAEAGRPETPLAAVWFGPPRKPSIETPRTIAIRFRNEPGWENANDVERIEFDSRTWMARVESG